MHGAALDRPGAHQRHLDDDVVEGLGKAAGQHLHLGAALDLEDAGRLRGADRLEGRLVVERDPREVDALVAGLGDRLDAALDRRQHPEPEQVDLQKAGVGARVLVPLDDLAPLHRRRLDRADVDQRPGREHHPAGVLGEVARQPPGLAGEHGEPAASAGSPRAHRRAPRRYRARPRRRASTCRRSGRPARSRPAAGRAPCRGREPRPASGSRRRPRPAPPARGRSGRGRGDQPLADVAREVEVDVGHLGDVVVEKAPQEQPGADRVDVREPGQIADDRADARAPAATRRQQVARRVGPADLGRDLAGELEQVEVQEEEARQARACGSPAAPPRGAARPRGRSRVPA